MAADRHRIVDRHIGPIHLWRVHPRPHESEHWAGSIRFWRVSFTVHLYQHRHSHSNPKLGDRWVFQTSTHYDRKGDPDGR